METGHGNKYRQLHIEDYLRELPAEQERVSGVYAHEWITGDTDTNANLWTDNLLDTILRSDNLNATYKKVKANNGAGGVDGQQRGKSILQSMATPRMIRRSPSSIIRLHMIQKTGSRYFTRNIREASMTYPSCR